MKFEDHLQKEHPFKRPKERFCFTYKRNGVRKVYNFPSSRNFFYVGRDNSMGSASGLTIEKDTNLSRNHAVLQYDSNSAFVSLFSGYEVRVVFCSFFLLGFFHGSIETVFKNTSHFGYC